MPLPPIYWCIRNGWGLSIVGEGRPVSIARPAAGANGLPSTRTESPPAAPTEKGSAAALPFRFGSPTMGPCDKSPDSILNGVKPEPANHAHRRRPFLSDEALPQAGTTSRSVRTRTRQHSLRSRLQFPNGKSPPSALVRPCSGGVYCRGRAKLWSPPIGKYPGRNPGMRPAHREAAIRDLHCEAHSAMAIRDRGQ